MCLGGFEKEIFASLENFFEKDSRHVVLAGYHVKSVNVDHIELDRTTPAALGGSNTISVDVGLIATGYVVKNTYFLLTHSFKDRRTLSP